MASCHWAALVILALLGAPAAAQAAQPQPGGTMQVDPNLVLPMAQMPDLVISAASAVLSCVDKKSVTANLTATVKNISQKGAADLTNVPWQIVIGAD